MPRPARWKRRLVRVGVAMAATLAALAIPDCADPVVEPPGAAPFVWDQDELWERLEKQYQAARTGPCPHDERFAELQANLDDLGHRRPGPGDLAWGMLEHRFFSLAAQVAACDADVPRLVAARGRLRRVAKDAARDWPADRSARDRLYRLLYGTRIAVEEVMLLASSGRDAALVHDVDEPSSAPSAMVEGVRLHSGDLLLSRGGAPTSAFIARGNDFPGNFSHVALVHISEGGEVSIIEAHIERGVAIADVAAYLADKKLRIAVLRLRADHPALTDDPDLPHRAATAALTEARTRHIAYDFAMDFRDHEDQFCSEVASAAYEAQGVELWQQLSTFSSPGLSRWMAAFGVENLETLAPSDLEYDHQLRVVAEWRDIDTLFDDHVDNAVIDALLESAEAGAEVGHAAAMLPMARLAKAYSVMLNLLGSEGPVPEGMSATVALRAQWLASRHAEIKAEVLASARAFEQEHGYRPPYWRLVELARQATAA